MTKSVQQKSVLEEILTYEPKKAKTTAEKVREQATNTFFYFALVASISGLATVGYFLFAEFFSSESPQKIFSDALSLIRNDDRCRDIFGASIAGFGEETSRGRRRHVAYHRYEKNGKERIRVIFHLKGSRTRGVAQAEKEFYDGDWRWRFLLIQTDGNPYETHIIIDNRV
ncbi:unnamed protein product [Dracunculus medinensis]|uniref:Mitochondrial import inner membrane translocase subunit Tim21 n=1 Tax=Dracunculus medinensis TaxID=318479 RepID=A0A0N4UIU6_DRAME|nr:unnamed protein product [Dracunculus medinensis]